MRAFVPPQGFSSPQNFVTGVAGQRDSFQVLRLDVASNVVVAALLSTQLTNQGPLVHYLPICAPPNLDHLVASLNKRVDFSCHLLRCV